MADAKITELVAGTLSSDELLMFVDDPSGLPVNKKIAYSSFLAGLTITESQISDLGTYLSTADIDTLAELNAIVADDTIIGAAATDASGYGFVVDEDNMASNLATKIPTQQSVKAYVDSVIAGLTALEAEDIDTLAEINAILGDATLVTVEATDASGYGWVIDEDNMASDSATKVPTQQSVKAYVDAAGGGGTSLPVVDTTGIAKGSTDATKIVRLEVDGLTTATTRVLTVQDVDGTIALTGDSIAASQVASGTLTHERGGLEADVSAYSGVPLITGGATSELKYNLAATTDPGVGDDSDDGYSVGSRWINVTLDKEFACLDATVGAAVWGNTTTTDGAGSGGCCLTVTKKTANYTAVAGDLVVCDSSGGAITITMPLAPTLNDVIGIYLEAGNLTLNTTIQGNGKVLSEFGSSLVMHGPGELVTFQYDGVKWVTVGQNGGPLVDGKDHFFGSADPTKVMRFNLSGITTGTTRTLTVPDESGTIALTSDSRFTDSRTPTAHASNHTDGTDDIQNATAAQKGLATAAQITKLDSLDAGADGTTWTARSATEANFWAAVTYGNGLFVATSYSGTNRVMTSHDGINWTARSAAEANNWFGLTYGNGLFVATSNSGTNRVMTSPDGITWTARSAAAVGGWSSVTYGRGLFVSVDTSGSVMTSPDGTTWTSRTAAAANTWVSVTYSDGLFVAVSGDGTNRVMTSPDGITWTARSAAEANYWRSVTYGNGRFVAVSSDGTNRVMTSPDGITWTARSAAEANSFYSMTYGNGVLVAVSIDGTNRVMTSGKQLDRIIL